MTARLVILIIITLIAGGCARSRYDWNGYDDKLYSYYKTPAESERLMEGLHEIILEAETEGRVPPGIYAEYGYMLYERGQHPDAIIWFGKERDKWPESAFFMERMIAIAGRKKTDKELNKGQVPQAEPLKEKRP